MTTKFDASALLEAWGQSRAPAGLDRAGRVVLLGRAAQALLRGELPDDESRLFLGSAIAEWLQHGGDLSRDFFQVVKPKSRHTASYLWRMSTVHPDERHDDEASAQSELSLECRE
jgi:hypothetical protein